MKSDSTSSTLKLRIVEFEVFGRPYKFATNNDDAFTDEILTFVKKELRDTNEKAGSFPQITQLVLSLVSLSERYLRLEKSHADLKLAVIKSSEKTLNFLDEAEASLEDINLGINNPSISSAMDASQPRLEASSVVEPAPSSSTNLTCTSINLAEASRADVDPVSYMQPSLSQDFQSSPSIFIDPSSSISNLSEEHAAQSGSTPSDLMVDRREESELRDLQVSLFANETPALSSASSIQVANQPSSEDHNNKHVERELKNSVDSMEDLATDLQGPGRRFNLSKTSVLRPREH